jgi:tetratricopeptide (TPR) repeat protein
VLAANPQSAVTLNYLGYMNADRGVQLEESLNYIKLAVSLDPTNGAYLDSLGWAYFKLGKYDLAEENLNKASLRMGSDPTVQDHLGDLFQKTGRLRLAAAHWERAVEEWNKTVPAEVDTDLLGGHANQARRRQSSPGQGRIGETVTGSESLIPST